MNKESPPAAVSWGKNHNTLNPKSFSINVGAMPVRTCKLLTFKNSTAKYSEIDVIPDVMASNSEKEPRNFMRRIANKLAQQILRIKLPVTFRMRLPPIPKVIPMMISQAGFIFFAARLEAKKKITIDSGMEKIIMFIQLALNSFTPCLDF